MSNGNNALDDYLVLLDKKKEASQEEEGSKLLNPPIICFLLILHLFLIAFDISKQMFYLVPSKITSFRTPYHIMKISQDFVTYISKTCKSEAKRSRDIESRG